jgi:hypothetical protein
MEAEHSLPCSPPPPPHVIPGPIPMSLLFGCCYSIMTLYVYRQLQCCDLSSASPMAKCFDIDGDYVKELTDSNTLSHIVFDDFLYLLHLLIV